MSKTPTIAGLFQVLIKEENARRPALEPEMPYFMGIYKEGPDFYNGIHELPITRGGYRSRGAGLGSLPGCIILDGEAQQPSGRPSAPSRPSASRRARLPTRRRWIKSLTIPMIIFVNQSTKTPGLIAPPFLLRKLRSCLPRCLSFCRSKRRPPPSSTTPYRRASRRSLPGDDGDRPLS